MAQNSLKGRCRENNGKFECYVSINDKVTVQKHTPERGKNQEFVINHKDGINRAKDSLTALEILNKKMDKPLSMKEREDYLAWADEEPYKTNSKKRSGHLGPFGFDKEDETEV